MAAVAGFHALNVQHVVVVLLAWIVCLEVHHGADLVRSYRATVLQAALPAGYQTPALVPGQGSAGCCGVLRIGLIKNGL